LRPGVLRYSERDSTDGNEVSLLFERGAARSNTQEKRDESIGSLLGYREDTGG